MNGVERAHGLGGKRLVGARERRAVPSGRLTGDSGNGALGAVGSLTSPARGEAGAVRPG
jgi:hypothetical protein